MDNRVESDGETPDDARLDQQVSVLGGGEIHEELPPTRKASGLVDERQHADRHVGLVLPQHRHFVAVVLDGLGECAGEDLVAAEVRVVIDRKRSLKRAIGRDALDGHA